MNPLAMQSAPPIVTAGAAPGWTVLSIPPSPEPSAGKVERDAAPIVLPKLDAGVVLRLATESNRATERVEVQVLSADGARELRERFAPSADAGPVEMRIPAAWLTAGQYQVVLRSADDPHRELGRLRIRVR